MPVPEDSAKARWRPLIWLLLAFILSVALQQCWNAWRYLNTPVKNPRTEFELLISPGTSFNQALRELIRAGVIERPTVFKLYAIGSGEAVKIKAGEYRLSTTLTPLEILNQLVLGRVVQHSLTLVEGWNFRQLRTALANATPELKLQTQDLSHDELMTALGFPGQHPEGRFLPDTYRFERGSSDLQFLQRAYTAMQSYLENAWPERQQNLPIKTPYEALILASIVEKETAVAEERPQIAGVFISRLRKNMRLQTDPTIIYGLGEGFDGNIRRKHLREDGPYNTYTRRGLTPTPIAMPGRAAVDAVLHPADTDALYFVSRGDGTHQFSRTLVEHEAAVDKYQRKK